MKRSLQAHTDRLLLAFFISLRWILCKKKQRKSAETVTLESSVETLNAKKCLSDFVFMSTVFVFMSLYGVGKNKFHL